MTDKALIDQVLDDTNSTDTELALAERLQAALAELGRVAAQWEDDGGRNP
jgi:hypothetical protein